MAATLTNTTTTNKYTDTQLGMSGFYQDGSIVIANNPASILLWKRSKEPGSPYSTEYTYVSPNAIPLIAGEHEWIVGLQLKSAIAGSPAQVFGWLQEPGTAGLSPGTPFTQSVAANGAVTPGQTIMTVSGRINGANGAPLGGTGFSCARNGTGDYTITFSPAFPNIPAVVVTPVIGAGAVRIATHTTPALNSVEVFLYVLGGTAADVSFDFIAIDPGS